MMHPERNLQSTSKYVATEEFGVTAQVPRDSLPNQFRYACRHGLTDELNSEIKETMKKHHTQRIVWIGTWLTRLIGLGVVIFFWN